VLVARLLSNIEADKLFWGRSV